MRPPGPVELHGNFLTGLDSGVVKHQALGNGGTTVRHVPCPMSKLGGTGDQAKGPQMHGRRRISPCAARRDQCMCGPSHWAAVRCPERWPSGLRRTPGTRVCVKAYRGFESHPLRHIIIDIIDENGVILNPPNSPPNLLLRMATVAREHLRPIDSACWRHD